MLREVMKTASYKFTKQAGGNTTKALSDLLKELIVHPDPAMYGKLLLAGSILVPTFDILSNVGDVAKEYVTSYFKPTWEMMGRAHLYKDNADVVAQAKAQELKYRMIYDLPYDTSSRLLPTAITSMAGAVSDRLAYNRAMDNFNQIYNNFPGMKYMNKKDALAAYQQLAAVAPQVAATAPGALAPYLNNAITNGPLYLGDVSGLVRANQSI